MSTPETEGPRPDGSPDQTRRSVVEAVQNLLGRLRRGKSQGRTVQEPQRREPLPPVQPPPREQPRDQSSEQSRPAPDKDNAREHIDLTREGSDTFQVLPGDRWAAHYPHGADGRTQAIERLFSGTADPAQELDNVTPDALIYDTRDIARHGYEAVNNRIHDAVTAHENYDFSRFAEFVAEMHGAPITADNAQALYNAIAQTRIQQVMLSTYDTRNRERIVRSLQAEGKRIAATINNMHGMDKILSAAKSDMLLRRQLEDGATHDAVLASLTDTERGVFEAIRDDYRNHTGRGNPAAYDGLIDGIRTYYTGQQPPEQADPPPSPRDTEEDFIDPPPESDKYPEPTETKEEDISSRKRFEVSPKGTSTEPMLGYYPRKHENVYDFTTHDWATPTNVSVYTETMGGDERQMITGRYATYETTIQVPDGYALDFDSLTFTGDRPSIGRDQFGNFKITGKSNGTFSIDFLKEEQPFIKGPEELDYQIIHRGQFAQETQAFLESLTGSDIEKAEAIREFIVAHHIYPEEDELDEIQSGLRRDSTAENYIQNLELSEKLECYSANTLFIAMLREAHIPSRLILGDYVDEQHDGKAILDGSTPHAWGQVWDGTQWVIIDATPAKVQQGENATDEPSDFGDGQYLPEEYASDQEVQQGTQRLGAAEEAVNQANERHDELLDALRDAEGFQQMKELMDEMQADEQLFDDMKTRLNESIRAKEQQMRQELEQKIAEMAEKGFIDEPKARELLEAMQAGDTTALDQAKNAADAQGKLYEEYNKIRAEVMPFVENAYRNLVSVLPKYDTIEQDRIALIDEGELDMEAVMDPDSYIKGEVFSPLRRQRQVQPKILMKFVVDTSTSAAGEIIDTEQKLLVAYSELVSRVEKDYGYIRFSIDAFSDNVRTVKTFDQSYTDTKKRHSWDDGSQSTILVRMMETMKASGGTNILAAVKNASRDLHREFESHKDYITAVQYVGDGGDTYNNRDNIRKYMNLIESDDPEVGFGRHLFSATMLQSPMLSAAAGEILRNDLGYLFQDPRTGDNRTTVASTFPELFQQSVKQFAGAVKALRLH